MNAGDNWTCRYCQGHQVISDERYECNRVNIDVDEASDGRLFALLETIICANTACRQTTFTVTLSSRHTTRYGKPEHRLLRHWKLLPPSQAKPLPPYIPEAIRDDYAEACAIRDLSPKASATLIRRCLQGCIRDFCNISKKRLVDEIRELKKLVDAGNAPSGVQADVVDAIDNVRTVGNIGAHMEGDINLIVDIDPDEAQILINLAELLFEEWYIARNQRNERIKKMANVAASKTAEIEEQKRLPSPEQNILTSPIEE